MGTWSAEPFGNDSAADWAFELDDAEDWTLVRVALDDLLAIDGPDQDIETIAIAAEAATSNGIFGLARRRFQMACRPLSRLSPAVIEALILGLVLQWRSRSRTGR